MSLPVEEETIPCAHFAFAHNCEMYRLVDNDTGQISFVAELKVSCGICGAMFRFLGVKDDINRAAPFSSDGGTALVAPMISLSDPAGDPNLS